MAQLDAQFHKMHEEWSERIYNNPSLLPARYCFVLTNLCNLKWLSVVRTQQGRSVTSRLKIGSLWLNRFRIMHELLSRVANR